ncbi:glycoside hydrolase N-terminal domain-containing protein [Limibacter armeniacum]|uniref:glycosyl hydrolase family 95 catalytic domain-containing protein n=1 Tax=Limibacter armeniacum TaxID=466084 RepID=UPI002FE65A48
MLRNIFLVVISSLVLCASSTFAQMHDTPEKGFTSWLPAAQWEDALLTGNGTLGAMVMGDPFEETIILNHALLFLPNEGPVTPPNMANHLEEIRQLQLDGKWEEAARMGVQLWEEAGYGAKKWTDPFVPAANLNFEMPASNIKEYRRMVNYETAEAIVQWKDQKGKFERSTFASRKDSVLVTRVTGTAPIDLDVNLVKHPHAWNQSEFISSVIKEANTTVEDDQYLHFHVTYNKPHQNSPLGYDGVARFEVKGGSLEFNGNRAVIRNAEEVLIYVDIKPYYTEDNSASLAGLKKTISAVSTSYDKLIESQLESHGRLFGNMKLDLKPTEEEQAMTSETLVLTAKKKTSAGIIQRQFEAARYNIICATGTNPPNLQGIWSGTWTPPWSSDFTHDGNVEVAVSHYLNGNMPELMLSYFDYHERMLEQYRINARQFYGAKGIHVPSHTSTHGLNNHYDETWTMEYWNGGAAWTASFFYDYYLYTGDVEFLKERAFPFISEALAFWEDFLVLGEDGMYMVNPSYSPENNPLEHRWQNCINATMDIVLVKELLRNWIASAKVLGVSKNEIRKKENMMALLPPYQINEADGTIREWLWDGFSENQSHRHASHLYGLYEMPDMDLLTDPTLKAAAAKTIEERMKIRKQHHGGEMSFGMCLMGNSAVTLRDKENTSEVLEYLSMYYWTKGMGTTHNPGNLFNMDISGGFPSLITRMLVNGRPGHIDVFPALPDDWKNGSVEGVLVRGQVEVNKLEWTEKEVDLSFTSGKDQELTLDFGVEANGKKVKVSGAKLLENQGGTIKVKVQGGVKVEVVWE